MWAAKWGGDDDDRARGVGRHKEKNQILYRQKMSLPQNDG